MSSIFVAQGAEAKVYEVDYQGKKAILKQRLVKQYRIRELDSKLNKQRMQREVKCMEKCRKAGVTTPYIYHVDAESHSIYMEKIIGSTLKTLLHSCAPIVDGNNNRYPDDFYNLSKDIGTAIGRMHDIDLVHGDLTTSNIMIRKSPPSSSSTSSSTSTSSTTIHVTDTITEGSNADQISNKDSGSIVMIDFGLGQLKAGVEDKAVDLYVLERAFVSTHPLSEPLVALVMESYRLANRKGAAVMQKLDQVRLRGRKRDCFG